MPESSPWPPPNYYDTFGPFGDPRFKVAVVHPIDPSGFYETPDRRRFQRYQLPLAPVEIGQVMISGYLRSTADGKLLDEKNREVGTIDHETGLFSIDIALSPELGDRHVEFLYPRQVAPNC